MGFKTKAIDKEDIMSNITKDSWRNKFVKKFLRIFVHVMLRLKGTEIKMSSVYRKN